MANTNGRRKGLLIGFLNNNDIGVIRMDYTSLCVFKEGELPHSEVAFFIFISTKDSVKHSRITYT